MSSAAHISTTTAILIGSVIIAVSVFFGIARLQPPPAAPAPVAPPVVAPVEPPAPAKAVPRETVAQQARDALSYQYRTLRSLCPLPPGERHNFVLNVTFDAQGTEVAHGITGETNDPRPELAGCISGGLDPLKVPPPGVAIMVEIPLSLP